MQLERTGDHGGILDPLKLPRFLESGRQPGERWREVPQAQPQPPIGLPLDDTAKRSVHGRVRSPDGDDVTFEYTWCTPTDGRPCRPDTRYVCDTRPLASTSQIRCCAFEYTMRRPLPELGGSGGPDGPSATQ